MRPGDIADGVEHLVAHVLARLRRKPLAPHARNAEHFQSRPALILERADGVRALRVEGVHSLIAVGYLETGFVDHLRRADPQMRQREHQVVALEHGAAAARDVAAKRLDVLVQIAGPVDARRQGLIRAQLVVDFSKNLIRADVVRHMPRLDREAGAPENLRRRAVVLPEEGHVVRAVNGDEVVRSDVEPLVGEEIERAVPPNRSAERPAVLLLRVRSLLAVDRLAGRIESLEVILRIQRGVAQEEKQVARHRVRPALGHDVDDPAGCLAELGRIRIGEHLKLAHGLLAERRAHAPDGGIVIVEPIDRDVVRPRPLSGERQARCAGRALLRRAIGHDGGRQQREADETPSVDRQMLDLRLGDDARDDGFLRIHDGSIAGHLDDLLAARDIQ